MEIIIHLCFVIHLHLYSESIASQFMIRIRNVL